MLLRLSPHIAECLLSAAAADERAASEPDPAIKTDYEKMARTWRHLARSYEFVESLEHFVRETYNRKDGPQPASPPAND